MDELNWEYHSDYKGYVISYIPYPNFMGLRWQCYTTYYMYADTLRGIKSLINQYLREIEQGYKTPYNR